MKGAKKAENSRFWEEITESRRGGFQKSYLAASGAASGLVFGSSLPW